MTKEINIGFFNRIEYEFTNIYEMDNLICISQAKIGSRVLDEACGYENRYNAVLGIDKQELYWGHIGIPEDIPYDKDKIERFRKVLNNILLGLEKRDIILFYRNPLDRYVSGLYQDLLYFYENTKDEESVWLSKLGMNSGISSEEIPNDLEEKLVPKIQNYLDVRISQMYDSGHTTMYLSGYLSLIHRSKMTQGSRVFLFNIESQDINDILSNYIDTSNLSQIHKGRINFSNPYLKNLVEREFYKKGDDILGMVRDKLKHEMAMYQLMRSSSLNFR